MRTAVVFGFEKTGEAFCCVEAEMLLVDDFAELEEALHTKHDVTGLMDQVFPTQKEDLALCVQILESLIFFNIESISLSREIGSACWLQEEIEKVLSPLCT